MINANSNIKQVSNHLLYFKNITFIRYSNMDPLNLDTDPANLLGVQIQILLQSAEITK